MISQEKALLVNADNIPFHAPLDEAHNDFFGLPSNPFSIYHTGPAWPLPTGPQAQRVPKEARPVCIHAISSVWHELCGRIYKYFDSVDLKWTTIDPVRFAEVGQEPGPLFLWVGVLPGTLSPEDARTPAARCKEILLEYGVSDVEIAFRESVYTQYTGPQPLDYLTDADPTTDPTFGIRVPFTPALGLPIAPKAFPYFEGTGCLYLCEGGQSDRVFLLTARHVALPPDKYSNDLYHRKQNNMPRREIIHLGGRAFQNSLEAMMDSLGHWDDVISRSKKTLERLGEHVDGEKPQTTSDRQTIRHRLEQAEAAKASVFKFYQNIASLWVMESQRILGHVVYAPPISVSADNNMFTEDWALIELHRTKFNWDTFRGNVIHLGSKHTPYEFKKKICPHPETRAKFEYPDDALMQLRDFVKYDELRHPTMLDKQGEACLIVFKNGAATGVTLGRATGLESFVRVYKNYNIHSTSMAIAVYPYSNADGAFCAPGDSGSVVADANSRIVGMLTGGAGLNGLTDVAYVTPYAFLDQQIKKAFPHSYLFPIRDSIHA